eukprot:CAMPEP_0178935510 /NCGR_PEP_ID=MMETSP0786-20121207/24595_1 /TAXON_ID=186022 /ORGANISM="Thalassionema frauenfeldii, Strain CCMP 1798" /LENGTH=333 /DNA_ID=CAMNT_0020613685 /DNA_START=67 /DNA_END=1069 /DNA_ORIENTATION=+
MGSLSKKLGQMTAMSLESESSQILRTIKPNKIPNSLSQRLDTTLKDSHDMRVFGMGTLASIASRERYVRFTSSLYGIYSTMEQEKMLEAAEARNTDSNQQEGKQAGNFLSASPVASFWNKHSTTLRRASYLKKDVMDVCKMMKTSEISIDRQPMLGTDDAIYSPATIDYINAIREAGEEDRRQGTGRLLGHAYTRYLADLMGGSVLGTPTRMALRLDEDMPTQYSFNFPASSSVFAESTNSNNDGGDQNNNNHGIPMSRKEYVESIYNDLNEAGKLLEKIGDHNADNGSLLEDVVSEAREAFRHNVNVYAEEPIIFDSVVGLKNIATGWVLHK